jgi:hypothetical protein
MTSFRIAVPVFLVAAAIAGCFTYYFVTPPPPAEADQRLPPSQPNLIGPDTDTPTNIDRRTSAEEKAKAAFERAAAEILKQLPAAQASAGTVGLPITGRIPLPKKRPLPRP